MLDTGKLPGQPEIRKAHFSLKGLDFGMLHVLSKFEPEGLELHQPAVVDMIMIRSNRDRQLGVPDGWQVDTLWYSDDYNVAAFVAFHFTVPFELKLLQCGGSIPSEVGYLLAGHLQLGEEFNFRNFQNYLRRRNLKYLPFVFRGDGIRFYVYIPTPERVEAGINTFKTVLSRIEELKPQLPSLLKDAYALVRLDEVHQASGLIAPAASDIRGRLEETLSSHRSQLGFVYQGLKGPQDADAFYYEMFATD